jgi:hypothetical protein
VLALPQRHHPQVKTRRSGQISLFTDALGAAHAIEESVISPAIPREFSQPARVIDVDIG